MAGVLRGDGLVFGGVWVRRWVLWAGLCVLVVLLSLSKVTEISRVTDSVSFSADNHPVWSVVGVSAPGVFKPGDGEDLLTVEATNTGSGSAVATEVSPVVVSVSVPAGLSVVGIEGLDSGRGGAGMLCSVVTVSCSMTEGVVIPGDFLLVRVRVSVGGSASGSLVSGLGVSGGGGTAGFGQLSTRVEAGGGAGVPFGIAPGSFLFAPSTLQAGAHPDLTTSFSFNQNGVEAPVRSVREIGVDLPAGVVGDPMAVPRCDMARVLSGSCPRDTAVGVATVPLSQQVTPQTVLVYNIAPYADEPAALGFNLFFPLRLDTALVRDPVSGEYHIHVSASNTTEAAQFNGTSVTLWGVPADHNGPGPDTTSVTGAFGSVSFGGLGGGPRIPFLSNPTQCGPVAPAGLSLESWPTIRQSGETEPPAQSTESVAFGPFTGCDALVFNPSINIAPDSTQAGQPTGLGVDIHLQQNENPEVLASPELRDATVTLPEGVLVSPSAADGLQACSEAQVNLLSNAPPACPDASKIGTVLIETPILEKPLTGSLYLAEQNNNPFHTLIAMYLVAEGSGVMIKLAGHANPNPVTGQLTATFTGNPQQPFTDLRLHFNGGPRAPLANTNVCGDSTSHAALTSWSGAPPAALSSTYQTTGCPAPQFSPSFVAGTTNNQAGSFSPLSVTLARTDADQAFSQVAVTTPPGLLGIIRNVTLCEEPQAQQGTCGPGSLIGHTTVGSGPGPTPFFLGGQVYITGPYKGAPFGLSIVVPAIAGPFNLGNVIVRARIDVDPATSQLTITSDPLPTILQGIPLQVRTINVTVDRPQFTFNPTNCTPMQIQGNLSSTQATTAHPTSRYQAANCRTLPFTARFQVTTEGKTSRKNGASLHVRIGYAPGQANIHSVAVILPKQLPARLTTIQQACPDQTFKTNPATCPTGSLVGYGQANTPILTSPLAGPAYLVSHGGAAFPDIVIVLQGQGIRLDLTGNVNINKNGVTSSTFHNVPDAPITSFDLILPEGPHSALSANGNLCNTTLHMPTTITAQNNQQIKQNTLIHTTHCTTTHHKARRKATKHKKK
jgi:hypothetical protein